MEKALIYFFMGISLSMDAFSLAISLGTTSPSKKEIREMSFTVGIFHFIMPLIGSRIGFFLKNHLILKANLITSFIFFILTIQMICNKGQEEKIEKLNLITILLIALTLSLDSLTVGFAFGLGKERMILASTIFMLISATFTYLGLLLGKKIKEKFQKKASILGIIIMFLLTIKYFFSS